MSDLRHAPPGWETDRTLSLHTYPAQRPWRRLSPAEKADEWERYISKNGEPAKTPRPEPQAPVEHGHLTEDHLRDDAHEASLEEL